MYTTGDSKAMVSIPDGTQPFAPKETFRKRFYASSPQIDLHMHFYMLSPQRNHFTCVSIRFHRRGMISHTFLSAFVPNETFRMRFYALPLQSCHFTYVSIHFRPEGIISHALLCAFAPKIEFRRCFYALSLQSGHSARVFMCFHPTVMMSRAFACVFAAQLSLHVHFQTLSAQPLENVAIQNSCCLGLLPPIPRYANFVKLHKHMNKERNTKGSNLIAGSGH